MMHLNNNGEQHTFTQSVHGNTQFQKAGARGISLLYASGDEGANCEGWVSNICLNQINCWKKITIWNFTMFHLPKPLFPLCSLPVPISGDKFKPETPGSSPWVTAVGGTTGSETERVSASGSVVVVRFGIVNAKWQSLMQDEPGVSRARCRACPSAAYSLTAHYDCTLCPGRWTELRRLQQQMGDARLPKGVFHIHTNKW